MTSSERGISPTVPKQNSEPEWQEIKPKVRKPKAILPEIEVKTEDVKDEHPSTTEVDRPAIVATKKEQDGFAYVLVRMLEKDQILAFFRELKKYAVQAHRLWKPDEPEDTSYLRASIDINIPKSARPGVIPHFGFAICHIYDDPGHKMFHVLLGRFPDGSLPEEKTIVDVDGSTKKVIYKFLTPYKPIMDPDQVADWVAFQEQQHLAGKVKTSDMEMTRDCYTTYKVVQEWKAVENSLSEKEDKDLDEIINNNDNLLNALALEVYKTKPEEKTQVEDDFDRLRHLTTVADFIGELNELLLPLKTKIDFVSTVEINAVPHYIQDASINHLCIQDVPEYVNKDVLMGFFSKYNRVAGPYERSYPSTFSSTMTKISGPYPHIWIEVDPNTKKRMANIAFSDTGNGDASFAREMMKKFPYPSKDEKGRDKIDLLLLENWPGENRTRFRERGHDSGRGRGAIRGKDRRIMDWHGKVVKPAPGLKPVIDTTGTRSPHMASLPGLLTARETRAPQLVPTMTPFTEKPSTNVTPAPVTSIFDIISGGAESGGMKSSWTKPLNITQLATNEEGEAPDSIIYHVVPQVNRVRGYDPNRRDDGNLIRFF